jgi:diguanylate cyclase (GGDEF)-like protein
VILPETSSADALVLAERIRSTIAEFWFSAGPRGHVQKTVSVGMSCYPDDAQSVIDLLSAADAALYRAKRTGKNRVLTA